MTPKQKAMLLHLENACRNFEVCCSLYTDKDFESIGIPQTISGARFLVKKLQKRIKELR